MLALCWGAPVVFLLLAPMRNVVAPWRRIAFVLGRLGCSRASCIGAVEQRPFLVMWSCRGGWVIVEPWSLQRDGCIVVAASWWQRRGCCGLAARGRGCVGAAAEVSVVPWRLCCRYAKASLLHMCCGAFVAGVPRRRFAVVPGHLRCPPAVAHLGAMILWPPRCCMWAPAPVWLGNRGACVVAVPGRR